MNICIEIIKKESDYLNKCRLHPVDGTRNKDIDYFFGELSLGALTSVNFGNLDIPLLLNSSCSNREVLLPDVLGGDNLEHKPARIQMIHTQLLKPTFSDQKMFITCKNELEALYSFCPIYIPYTKYLIMDILTNSDRKMIVDIRNYLAQALY